jgi:ankyrin repeat protein
VRDAGELSLRVSTGRRRGLRTVAIVACRGALLAARRAGCIARDQRVVTLIWHKFKHADKVPSDMAYFDGYALVPSPRKRAAPVRAEAGDGVDAARSAAARAALERQHAALIKTGVVVFDMSASCRDAAPRRDGMKRLNHDRVLSHANDDVPADPARAALLVEALGPLAARTPLRDAARRRYLTTTDTFYVSKRALEAALARSAAAASSVDLPALRRLVARFAWRTFLEDRSGDDDAASDYDVGGRERRKFHVTKEQFDVLCREVATPRGDEIWAEAMAGLLLPLAPIWVSSEDEWREPGDVREGDVAALDLPPSLKPACLALAATERCGGDPVAVFSADMEERSGVLATHFDAFGTTIFPALAVLDDLAHPREGEADGAAGAARVEAAIASLLTAERLPPLKAGDAVRVLDDRDADWFEAGFTDGQWSDATFVKFGDHGSTAVVNVGGEDDEVLLGAIQRRYSASCSDENPPAAKLLTLAVMDGRNDVVARLLRPGGIDHALMYAVPTDVKSRFDPRATALDRAIAKGNSVAAALLVNQYGGGASFVPHACNSVRREKHLMGNFSIRLEGEFLRALGLHDHSSPSLFESFGGLFSSHGRESDAVTSADAGDLVGVRRGFAALAARVRRADLVHSAWQRVPVTRIPKLRDVVDAAGSARATARFELAQDVNDVLKAGAAQGDAAIVAEALLQIERSCVDDLMSQIILKRGLAHAFETCVMEGHASCLDSLLDSPLAQEYSNAWGTPDMWRMRMMKTAAIFGHVDVLNMLRRRGMQFSVPYLSFSAKHGQVDAVAAFLGDASVLQALRQGETSAIVAAINFGRVDVLKTLLSVDGISLDSDSRMSSDMFLQLAATEGFKDITEVLLDHGLPVDSRGSETHLTALGIAVKNNRFDLAKFLLERGASLCATRPGIFKTLASVVNKEYMTHDTARVDMARLLLAARPEECTFDARDGCQDAVLFATIKTALTGRESNFLRFLLEETVASPNAPSSDLGGATALHLAICDYSKDCATASVTALESKLATIRLLIEHDADLHAPRTTEVIEMFGIPAGLTPYEAIDRCPPEHRAKLKEFVDTCVQLRETTRPEEGAS